MSNWFECKVKFVRQMENGSDKKVTEAYLVDALSFTEAEGRITQEVTPFISGEYEVSDIKKVKYAEVVKNHIQKDDRYYKCKVVFHTLDEKSGKEKNTASMLLVKADDLETAVKYTVQHMKSGLADWSLQSVTETAYMDVYEYVKS